MRGYRTPPSFEVAATEVLDALGLQELTARQVCEAIGESRGDWDDYAARVRTDSRLRRMQKLGMVTSRMSDGGGNARVCRRRLWKRADVAEPDPPEPKCCPHCGEPME